MERTRQLSNVPECDPVAVSRWDMENEGGMGRGVCAEIGMAQWLSDTPC